MRNTTVRINFVDGTQDETEIDGMEEKYQALSKHHSGRELIENLLSDEWRAPPNSVELWNGERLIARIPYG